MNGLREALNAFCWWSAQFWRTVFRSSFAAPKRVIVLRFEELEERAMPSAVTPDYTVFHPAGSANPYYYTSPVGLTPAQIRHAYGIDAISFNGVVGDGTGQTIAIIDAYDDPKFVNSTDPNFVNSDLHKFDQALGIPDPPSFRKVSQTGSTTALPGQDAGWGGEIALDVEWAHALAPGANILLVEARSASYTDLVVNAVNYARQQPGVSVVTMSFGGDEFSSETSLDRYFTTPGGHTGVTFIASTGDSGTPGGYPALSPNVLAVGGTSLYLSGGNYGSESGWSGSGGGVSTYEPLPGYQQGFVSGSKRATPDVSFDADPNTGVAVYDSLNNSASAPWWQVGGTSFSSPAWASLIAIANQGRAINGQASLDGPTGTLPKIYSLPASDFHDITTGDNGYAAGVGYDLVTGRGSPIANLLIPDLVGITSPPTISSISNQLVAPGASSGAIPFTVGDQGLPASSLTVTATSSNQAVLPNSAIVLGGSGANRTISLFAPPRALGTTTITITVTATPTLKTSTSFTLSVDHAPVLPVIGNVSVPYGSTPTPIALHASDADVGVALIYSVVLHDPLADLETRYGLISKDGYFNYRGQGEKYLLSANGSNAGGGGWYVLMPTGSLLAWNGSLATSSLVATLPTSVYANPALLTNKTGVPLVTSGANPLYDLKLKFGLVTPASSFHYRGANEYYLRSSNNSNALHGGWYVLTANNALLAWNGSLNTSTLVANLTPFGNVYANPALLTSASLPTTIGVTASIDPASGGTLTLTPTLGFDRTVQVTVNVSDAIVTTSRTFTFGINDTAPTIPAISPISVGPSPASLTYNIAATGNGTLAYTVGVIGYNPLYDLKLQYGLNSDAAYFNYYGQNEWYFQSGNGSNPDGGGWYVLMPTGLLYAWDGISLPTTVLQSQFDDLSSQGVYANPALLFDAVQPTPSVFVNRGPLYDLRVQFGLNSAAGYFNDRGQNEWYFQSGNGSNPNGGGWYVLMPSGMLYAWNSDGLAATIAQIPAADLRALGVYADPRLLSNAQPVIVNDALFNVKSQYGLNTADIAFNYRGASERYFQSSNGSNPAGNGWFVLMPSGLLYAWNLGGLVTTITQQPVADLSATGAYAKTALLYASTGQASAVNATIDAAGNVTLTPNVAFVGTVQVIVTVSDGAEKTTKSFLYTVIKSVPTLPVVANVVASSASGGVTIANLGAADAGNATLSFSATTISLFDIRAQFGLTALDIAGGFNFRGDNEKYFQSTNGSNASGGGWYVLMPNGALYAFNIQDQNQHNLNFTLSQAPVANLSMFGVYANPSLLYNAMTAPSVATVFTNQSAGGTLQLTWSPTFSGTFLVTVYVSNGTYEVQRTFSVTVS